MPREAIDLTDLPEASPFDPEGTGYDYDTAIAEGLGPDETGHWSSRAPESGLILKGRGHQTFGLTIKGEEEAGYEIYKGSDGRYYSKPKGPDVSDLPEATGPALRQGEEPSLVDRVLDVFRDDPQKAAAKAMNAYAAQEVLGIPMRDAMDFSEEIYNGLDKIKAGSTLERLQQSWRKGQASNRLADIGWQLLAEGETPELLAELEKLNAVMADEDFTPRYGLVEEAVRSSLQMAPLMGDVMAKGAKRGMEAGIAGGSAALIAGQISPLTPEELITVPATVLFAGGAGMAAGSAEESMRKEAGLAYVQFLGLKDPKTGQKMNPTVAKLGALAVGLPNALLEVVQVKTLLKTIPGLDKLFKEASQKAVQQVLIKGSLPQVALKYAGELGKGLTVETLTEVAQETTNIVMQAVTTELTNAMEGTSIPQQTAQQIIAQLGEISKEAALGFIPMLLPGNIISAGREYMAANKTTKKKVTVKAEDGTMTEVEVELPSPRDLDSAFRKALDFAYKGKGKVADNLTQEQSDSVTLFQAKDPQGRALYDDQGAPLMTRESVELGIREAFKDATDEEVVAVMSLHDAAAATWSSATGNPVEAYWGGYFAGVVEGLDAGPKMPIDDDNSLYQALRVSMIDQAAAEGLLDEADQEVGNVLQEFARIDEQMPFGGGGRPQPNAFNINRHLDSNPVAVEKIRELERRGNVKILDDDGHLAMSIPVEERNKVGEGGEVKAQYGGFFRSFSQMYLDNMSQPAREKFQRGIIKTIEAEYKRGKGKHLGKSIDSISKTDIKGVRPAVRSAHKTVAAANFNSQCPMFIIGNHGCYLDMCYVTSMARSGQGTPLYRSAFYAGDLLQFSQEAIDKLNNAGGLRINGAGDTQMEDLIQWVYMFKHAAMRGLKLKVISKQDATFEIIDRMQHALDHAAEWGLTKREAQQVAKKAREIIVQPTVDAYWIPVSEDVSEGSAVKELQISDLADRGTPQALEMAAKSYREFTGRDAKVIDGKLWRKYGFSWEQLQALQEKYPNIKVQPRTVVTTAKEIAETALHNPDVLQTWMHAKVPGGRMYSDIEGRVLEEGDLMNFMREITIWKDKEGWHIGNDKQKSTGAYKETEAYIKANYTEAQQEKIFKVLKGQSKVPSALCCQAGADADACMNCRAHCHQGTYHTGEALQVIAQRGQEMQLFQEAPDPNSEAFRQWFGDSKVVDEKGEPLVVYHATDADKTYSENPIFRYRDQYLKEEGEVNRNHREGVKALHETYGPNWEDIYDKQELVELSESRDKAITSLQKKYIKKHGLPLNAFDVLNKNNIYAESIVRHEHKIDVFDIAKSRDIGIHFGTIEQAKQFGSNPYAVYLSIQNPAYTPDVFSRPGQYGDMIFILGQNDLISQQAADDLITEAEYFDNEYSRIENSSENARDDLEKLFNSKRHSVFFKEVSKQVYQSEYDGIIYENEVEGGGMSYVAFSPTQIKSVFNKGTWDPKDPRILYQASAYHGGGAGFDRFSTEYAGTGEGGAAFGWGLYFTELEGIARHYANMMGKRAQPEEVLAHIEALPAEKKRRLSEEWGKWYGYGDDPDLIVETVRKDIEVVGSDDIQDYLEMLSDIGAPLGKRHLYRVTLHEGKQPGEYTWLDWYEEVPQEILDQVIEAVRSVDLRETSTYQELVRVHGKGTAENYLDTLEQRQEELIQYLELGELSGQQVYKSLFMGGRMDGKGLFQGKKGASLFLLDAGIDGIRYPADSLRGNPKAERNYVVFDENAITIEEHTVFQQEPPGPKGAVTFLQDGRAIIRALQAPDISTLIHESAHIWRRVMADSRPDLLERAEAWAGVKDGVWTVEAEEKFARAFERWVREGKAPTVHLERIFQQLKNWLFAIYTKIKTSEIDVKLSPEIRGVFREMFGGEAVGMTVKVSEGKGVGIDARMEMARGVKNAKQRIHIISGMTKVGDVISEEMALKTKLQAAAKAAKDAAQAIRKLERAKRKAAVGKERGKFTELKRLIRLQKAAKKQRQYIEKLAKLISKAPGKGIDFYYRQAIEALQAGIDPHFRAEKTLKNREYLREVIEKRPEIAAQIPRKVWEKTYAKSMGEMTIRELEEIAEYVKQLRKLGALKRKLTIMKEKRELASDRDAIVTSVLQGGDIEDTREIKSKYALKESPFRKTGRNLWVSGLRPNRLADQLDGGQRFKGATHEVYIDRVNDATETELNTVDRRMTAGQEKMEELGIALPDLGVRHVIDTSLGPVEFDVDELIDIYIGMKNEKKALAILYGNFDADPANPEVAMGDIEKCLAVLTPKQKALGDWIIDEYEQHKDRLREAVISYENRDMEYEENYSPIRRMEVDYTTFKQQIIDEILHRRHLKKAQTEKGMTISRIEIPPEFQKPVRLGAMSTWMSQVSQQEHYITMTPLVKRLHRLLDDDLMQEAITQQFHRDYIKALRDYVDRVADPDIYRSFDQLDNVSRRLRNHVALAYLAGNLLTMAKQLPGLFLYMADAGPAHLIGSALKLATNPMEHVKFVEDRDAQVRHRSINRELEELKAMEGGWYAQMVKEVGLKGMWGIEVLDKVVVTVGWRAVYDKAIAEGKCELEAIREARNATLRTQGQAMAKDLPKLYASNEVLNWLLQFTNGLNQVWNLAAYDLPMYIKRGDKVAAAYSILGMTLSGMTMWMIGAKDVPDEPKDWLEALSQEVIASIPLIGTSLAAGLAGRYRGVTIPPLEAVTDIGRAIADPLGKYKAFLEAIAVMAGFPIVFAKRLTRTLEEGDLLEMLGPSKD